MPLPPAFLDELRARTPLPALIGRKTKLARNGRQWKGCCPFHNEKTPSFYVYDDHFHCFGCGAHGDAITFLMRAEGTSFPEAVERLAAEAGLEVPKATPQQAERERRARDLHGVLALAEAAYRRRLRAPEGAAALDYLRRRGLTDATIERFGLGWSGEGRGALAAELKAEGVEPDQLVATGLLKEREGGGHSDMFFGRVIFPIRDRRGRTISFGGRILGDGQPKYLNGPETTVFVKRRTLYGQDLARDAVFRGATLLVVEGYMDVIVLHQSGFDGAVAPLGTALTEEHLEELWRMSPEPLICLDGDAAGARAAMRTAGLALPFVDTERRLRFATLPAGEDPDTYVAKAGEGAFRALLASARPMTDVVYDMAGEGKALDTPEGRAAHRNDLMAAVARIGGKALAAEWRSVLLDRFFASRPGRASFKAGGPRPSPGRGRWGEPRLGIARPQRPPIQAAAVRLEQARNLLALLLHHPLLLHDVEEVFAHLDMPEGPPTALRAAMLDWLGTAETLDSEGLAAHLASSGLGDAAAWATRRAGLPPEALPAAQPAEALDGFWQLFGFLRGEAALVEDRQEAERALVERNDPAAQARVIRLGEALDALRRGEAAIG